MWLTALQLPGDRRVLPIKIRREQLADLDRPQDPVSIDEIGLRPGDDAVGGLDTPAIVDDGWPRRFVLGDERPSPVGWIVHEHADDLEALGPVGGELLLEERKFLATGDARLAPEVDDDRVAAQIGQIEGRAVEGRPGDVRSGLPPCWLIASAASTELDERDNRDRCRDGDGQCEKDWTTRRGRSRLFSRR
jgi:hypothetical protein